MGNRFRNKPQVKRQKRAAAQLRRQHGLCEHADDEVACPNDEEAERVATLPPVMCEICNKPRLRVAFISNLPAGEVGPAIKDILR